MVTPMEFKEDIQKRRTTFQFTGTPVTAEQIKWIIRAGITAPSFDHKRKWNLIAVTSEMAKRKVTDYIDPLPCKDTPPENPVQEMIQIAFPKQKKYVRKLDVSFCRCISGKHRS